MRSSTLRRLILCEFAALWERNPHPHAIIPPTELLSAALHRKGLAYEDRHVQATLTSLVEEGYLEEGIAPHPDYSPDTPGARITVAGRQYLAACQEQRFTRIIAVVGALTGIIAIVLSLCALLRG